MLQFDGTLLFIALSFILFCIVLNLIFYNPMKKVRDERVRYIRNNKRYYSYNTNKIQEFLDKKHVRITKAKLEAREYLHSKSNDANNQKATSVASAIDESKEKISAAKTDIENQKNEAKKVLRQDVALLAQSITSKILGKEVSLAGLSDEVIEKAMNG